MSAPTPMTEGQMREMEAARPATIGELSDHIESLVKMPGHDYGTCVYAMSLAATAAFNYVAGQLGVTGFQASCADLDIVRRTRLLKGPFILLKGEDMLFPQYSLQERLQEAVAEWTPWAAEEAKKLLAETRADMAHPNVIEHWKRLAGERP